MRHHFGTSSRAAFDEWFGDLQCENTNRGQPLKAAPRCKRDRHIDLTSASLPEFQLVTEFGVSASGLSMTVQRVDERLRSDAEFVALLLRVREELGR